MKRRPLPPAREVLKRQLSLFTHRIHSLPVVVLMPHSRCNCRCVMCDIWKANSDKQELRPDQLEPHMESFEQLEVRSVVLSGGEALLHANLWTLCELLKARGIEISLLSTGMTLEAHADEVSRWCAEVIVSLDGDRELHDRIRGIPGAFDRLAAGVRAVRAQGKGTRVTGRSVVQRLNYRELETTIGAARGVPLDQISFLPADVTSTAFNRPEPWNEPRVAEVGLSAEEADGLERLIEGIIERAAGDFAAGFIAESPDKLRRIAHHYQAINGTRTQEPRTCNAPWVSTVIEADGIVRPCFFHEPLGSIHEAPLVDILNSKEAIGFRRNLDVGTNAVCRDCVCTLHLSPWQSPVRTGSV